MEVLPIFWLAMFDSRMDPDGSVAFLGGNHEILLGNTNHLRSFVDGWNGDDMLRILPVPVM